MERQQFIDGIRQLANLYEANPHFEPPATLINIYMFNGLAGERKCFHEIRALPGAVTSIGDSYFAKIHLPLNEAMGVEFSFTKSVVGRTVTVTKQVEEYVLDDSDEKSPSGVVTAVPAGARED